ncbi:hypothetical protein AB1Y20_003515 [Prymnesium parvum]|uniref:Uncharacterized protein n=1 Tax=Prymnesium parvum TaxID=97485 RepID=A0AB34J4V1_PRYPA
MRRVSHVFTILQATLRSLQQCVLKGHTTAAGSWMPMGRLDHAFRPDWTVADRPYAFAPPTTYKWAEFERIQQRLRTSPSGPDGGRLFLPPDRGLYLLGAIHLTDSPSVPLSILKDLTATEYHARDAVGKMRRASTRYGADELQRSLVLHSRHSRRMVPVSRLSAFERQMLFVPWYLQCNPSRFPYMFDQPDRRNEFVAAKLAELLPER